MSSFPLHKLSNNAAKLILRHMEPHEKLAYSFCSTTARNTVKSLNLSTSMIRFEIGTSIRVTVHINRRTQLAIFIDLNLDSFPRDQEFNICVTPLTPVNAIDTGTWSLPKFTNQTFLYHLLEIFHHPRLDDLFLYDDATLFEVIEPLWKIVDGVKVGSLSFFWSLREQFISRALKTILNCDELYVFNFHGQEVDKILMQNLRRVINSNAHDMKIDQVLISNFELIQLNFTMFVEKDFNRFLKLWICGSNPRLKQFHAGGPVVYRPLDAELILKGIKYKRIPSSSNAVHVRKMIGGWEKETRLAGGYIIRRFNGNDAVVVIENDIITFITDCFQSN